jgi:hypothetical protein
LGLIHGHGREWRGVIQHRVGCIHGPIRELFPGHGYPVVFPSRQPSQCPGRRFCVATNRRIIKVALRA